jgi:hypothetical protein
MAESPEPADTAESKGPSRRLNPRSLTLTALLGVFILAVFFAVARQFLPGRLSRAMRRRSEQGEGKGD